MSGGGVVRHNPLQRISERPHHLPKNFSQMAFLFRGFWEIQWWGLCKELIEFAFRLHFRNSRA